MPSYLDIIPLDAFKYLLSFMEYRSVQRFSLASREIDALNLHQYVKYMTLPRQPTMNELNFLIKNKTRFSGVTHFSSAEMLCYENYLEMDLASDLLIALAPQLTHIRTQSDLVTGAYSSQLVSSLSYDSFESLIVLSAGYSAGELTRSTFKQLKTIWLNAHDARHLEWLNSISTLENLSIYHFTSDDTSFFALIRSVVGRNPDLRLLNIFLHSVRFERRKADYLFNVHDSIANLQTDCAQKFAVPLSRLRINDLSLWQSFMLLTPTGMDASRCAELFLACHGRHESPADRISSIMDVINMNEAVHTSKQTWRQHAAMKDLLQFMEDQISIATDAILDAGEIVPLNVLLAHVVIIIIRALIPDRDTVLKWFKRLEDVLLDNAEVSPADFFACLSQRLHLGPSESAFTSICVKRKSLVSKYGLGTILGDFSVLDDKQLFVSLINDPSGTFLELLPQLKMTSSKWAYSIIAECDDTVVPLETKRRIVEILASKKVSSFGSYKLPAYFSNFLDDEQTQQFCMQTMRAFPSLLHKAVDSSFGILCMQKHGNLDFLRTLVFSEGKFFPGLLESPFRAKVHDGLWAALLRGMTSSSGASIDHWVDCLLKFRLGSPSSLAKRIESNSLRTKVDADPTIKEQVLKILANRQS
eukprot:TRINITY_DN4852_c0_g1_i1.p1 TRINITY_DN4852_c0_g1~~TRINITY_DN4852_c0_g1_i1.p1  ORF type:complete len:643 (-),score=79.33 TRINITY_DN4852_c0_g1_i1:1286-3214(-)